MIEGNDLSPSKTWKSKERGKKEKISANLPQCVHNVFVHKDHDMHGRGQELRGGRDNRARPVRAFVLRALSASRKHLAWNKKCRSDKSSTLYDHFLFFFVVIELDISPNRSSFIYTHKLARARSTRNSNFLLSSIYSVRKRQSCFFRGALRKEAYTLAS
jgi:hypothetical protein